MIPDFFHARYLMKTTEKSPLLPLSKGFSVFLCALLSAAVIAVPLLLFTLPSSDYSEDENRMLATVPPFSADTLFAGEYTEGLSTYLRDRLPLRSTLLKTKAAVEYASLRQENKHVIAARNAYLVKRFEYTDEQLAVFRTNVAAIDGIMTALSQYEKPVSFVCAPRAVDVLASLCPEAVEEPTERSVWQALDDSEINATTVTELLCAHANAGEKVWYRTDHHWTALGAYYVYATLGDALGYTPLPRAAFTEVTVCEDFLGTTYSACLAPFCRADRITAMRYAGDENFVCTDLSTGAVAQGFYREEALAGKDKYEYFLGRNVAHLRIVKDETAPRPTLLVIKDSYAQSLVPFLARHFDIELIDLRYFRTDATETVRHIVTSPHYAGTLILCNADTLTGDAGFSRLPAENL